MDVLPDILTRPAHWLLRVRNRRGYGIHSPFAFGLVTGVVYETGAYYAYAPLQREWHGRHAPLRQKDCRLLLRLANFAHPHTLLLWDVAPDTATAAYLRAGCTSARTAYGPQGAGEADMVVTMACTPALADTLTARLRSGGLLVVHDIHSSRPRREGWRRICASDCVTVTFDLRDFGLAFVRPDLQRQHYRINYF